MAGDWIPMRLDLDRDPAVVAMAHELGLPILHVVGACWKVWSWFAEQSSGGHGDITVMFLDSHAEVPGLSAAMMRRGWLRERDGGGLSIPNFDRWVGRSAKDRLKAARRQANKRLRDRHACHGDVTSMSRCTGQDNSVTTTTPLPPADAGGRGAVKPRKAKPEPDPLAVELCRFLGDGIALWKPDARITCDTSARSVEGMRLLVRADGRDPERVKDVIAWLFGGRPVDYQPRGEFDWRPNIASGATLRKHWDKLSSAMEASRRAGANGGSR